jgi:hypothetical protein
MFTFREIFSQAPKEVQDIFRHPAIVEEAHDERSIEVPARKSYILGDFDAFLLEFGRSLKKTCFYGILPF